MAFLAFMHAFMAQSTCLLFLLRLKYIRCNRVCFEDLIKPSIWSWKNATSASILPMLLLNKFHWVFISFVETMCKLTGISSCSKLSEREVVLTSMIENNIFRSVIGEVDEDIEINTDLSKIRADPLKPVVH